MDAEPAKQSRARTPEAKDERRLAILGAALDEFFERGFAQARMEDIAERAGVSKGTVYLYFTSKAAVFEGLVDTYARPNRERLAAVLSQPLPAMPRIREMLTLAPQLITRSDMPKLMKIMVSDAQTFPELVRGYRITVIEPMLQALQEVVEAAQANGEFRAGPPGLIVRLVVAPVIMSALWRIVFQGDARDQPDTEALLGQHLEMLERALLADTGGESGVG